MLLSWVSVILITSKLMLISLRRVWSWSKLYEREDMSIWKKIVSLMVTWHSELNAFLKSSTSKYWEEFSKSDSRTASLCLSMTTFSRKLHFLVKALTDHCHSTLTMLWPSGWQVTSEAWVNQFSFNNSKG